MRQRFVPLAMLMAAMLTACNSDSEEVAGPDNVATLAIDALAADLGIDKDKITVDTIRPVDWPDSSIGCPKPGQAYLQVITPGHKITLRVERQVHVVHEANKRAFVCHQTKAFAGVNPQRELVFGFQMISARKDLATRLAVPESDIKPGSAEERTWDDAGLGCPEAGKDYPPAKVTGWVMTLRHKNRDYT